VLSSTQCCSCLELYLFLSGRSASKYTIHNRTWCCSRPKVIVQHPSTRGQVHEAKYTASKYTRPSTQHPSTRGQVHSIQVHEAKYTASKYTRPSTQHPSTRGQVHSIQVHNGNGSPSVITLITISKTQFCTCKKYILIKVHKTSNKHIAVLARMRTCPA